MQRVIKMLSDYSCLFSYEVLILFRSNFIQGIHLLIQVSCQDWHYTWKTWPLPEIHHLPQAQVVQRASTGFDKLLVWMFIFKQSEQTKENKNPTLKVLKRKKIVQKHLHHYRDVSDYELFLNPLSQSQLCTCPQFFGIPPCISPGR